MNESEGDLDRTQNSILRISDSKTVQLIELYQSEPCLWKPSHYLYRTRRKRTEAATRIARKLRIKNFTAKHVMVKFKNLRNFYCQELKKMRKSVEMGDGENAVYLPKVFWFSKMDSFLRPHVQLQTDLDKQSTTLGNAMHQIAIKEEEQEENRDSESECVVTEDADASQAVDWAPVVSRPTSIAIYDEEEIPTQRSQKRSAQDSLPPLAKLIRKPIIRNRTKNRTLQYQCSEKEKGGEMLQTITGCLEQLTRSNNDAFECFGKYVATMLRTLPKADALALQPRIVELLTSSSSRSRLTTVTSTSHNPMR